MRESQNIEIQNFLPHRPPMLMIDNLILITAENSKTKFRVKDDCVFVESKKLQEVGLIENAAQTCSTIAGQTFFDKDDTEGKSNKLVGFISAIKTVAIYDLPSVNEEIETKADLIAKFDAESYSICTMNCTTSNKNKKIADFTMNLFIQEIEKN